MKIKISIILAILSILFCSLGAFAQISDETLGNPKPVSIEESVSLEITPLSSVSVLTGNASTTAVVLSAMADRRVLEVKVNEASKYLWVSVGSTTATVSGTNCVMVSSTAPFKAEISDDIAIATIASEAFSFTTIQYK